MKKHDEKRLMELVLEYKHISDLLDGYLDKGDVLPSVAAPLEEQWNSKAHEIAQVVVEVKVREAVKKTEPKVEVNSLAVVGVGDSAKGDEKQVVVEI